MSPKERLQHFAHSEAARFLSLQLLTATSVLMMAALIVMSVTLSGLKQTRIEEAAAQDTMLELTTIESRLVDFDGALNGYAVSGIAWYQMRMKDDYAELHAALIKLGHSLASDADQMRRYKRIIALVNQRDSLNDYLSSHREEIARSATAVTAHMVSDRIRGRLWEVLSAERAKRKINHETMISQAENSYWIALGIVVLTFAFGALCTLFVLARRER